MSFARETRKAIEKKKFGIFRIRKSRLIWFRSIQKLFYKRNFISPFVTREIVYRDQKLNILRWKIISFFLEIEYKISIDFKFQTVRSANSNVSLYLFSPGATTTTTTTTFHPAEIKWAVLQSLIELGINYFVNESS